MGQYYKPIILAPKQDNKPEEIRGWLLSHDYDCGLKLMEHSWLGNLYVQTFEKLISPEGLHHKSRVVWAGDYADGEPELTHADEQGREREVNLYGLCGDVNEIEPKAINVKRMAYRYILNHTTKQFVDKKEVPVTDWWTDEKTGKKYPFTIHPLPLLTCEGNGRGGGDYRGDERGQVGVWARHSISVANKVPTGYTQFKFDLTE